MSEQNPIEHLRREPPRFRLLEVLRREEIGPRLVRVTVGGPELDGFEMPEPAGSVRLLLPDPETGDLEVPRWNGNEFLNGDGTRPLLRTVTPRHHRPDIQELDVDVVIHGPTPLSKWALDAEPGSMVGMSGPGRGYEIDLRAEEFVLAGDESALPAIAQLMESIPHAVPIRVLIEVAEDDGVVELPGHPGADVSWFVRRPGAEPGDAMVEAIGGTDVAAETRLWVAGEAAAVQAVRGDVLKTRGMGRQRVVIRGYWKHR